MKRILLFLAVVIAAVSCKPEELAQLSVSPTSVELSGMKGSHVFSVKASGKWTVTKSADGYVLEIASYANLGMSSSANNL